MTKRYRRSICWLRRDLRLHDHRPLAEACRDSDEVILAFVFDKTILDQLEDKDDRRVNFIHRSVTEIAEQSIQKWGSNLVVLHGDPAVCIPEFAISQQAQAVFAGRDYEPSAILRDEKVEKQLRGNGATLNLVKDQVTLEAGDIMSQSGCPLKVYTPYSKAWRRQFDGTFDAKEYNPDLSALSKAKIPSDAWTLKDLGFLQNELWLEPGARAGQARLAEFSNRIANYQIDRDFPGLDGTSGLSVHLRFGTVSVRECVRAALNHGPAGDKWLSELIWREFYQDVLAHHPHVVEEAFQPASRGIDYLGNLEHFEAWRQGKTGFPIVDAAMRCLNATGWMHNRLRMVVASFFTKDLLLDYRLGEAYFARHLLDFELASNNGGWQWAASTGVDAQPYFRVFNPVLQSRKFDPNGKFLRRWLPELAELKDDAIHWPHEVPEFDLLAAGVTLGETYPHSIVDHAIQRDLAIKLLESARHRLKPA